MLLWTLGVNFACVDFYTCVIVPQQKQISANWFSFTKIGDETYLKIIIDADKAGFMLVK